VYAIGRKLGTDVFRPLSPRHPPDEKLAGLLLLRAEGRPVFLPMPNGVLSRNARRGEPAPPRWVVLLGMEVGRDRHRVLRLTRSPRAEQAPEKEGTQPSGSGAALMRRVLDLIRRLELGRVWANRGGCTRNSVNGG